MNMECDLDPNFAALCFADSAWSRVNNQPKEMDWIAQAILTRDIDDSLGGYATLKEAWDVTRNFQDLSLGLRAEMLHGWKIENCSDPEPPFNGCYTERESMEAREMMAMERTRQEYLQSAQNYAQGAMIASALKDTKSAMLALASAMYEMGKISFDLMNERIERNPDLERELQFVRDASTEE